MSTTTGHDLINRADQLARELSRFQLPVETELWESFDTTAYRLMRELIGPGRDDAGASTRRRATLLQVIHAYPTPLRPPLDADFSVTEATRFVTVSREVLIRRIREGEVPTHVVGGQPRIDAADLDARTDITPTDPADPHPLARLSTTLGVLADMVNQERRHPGTVDGLSDDAVRDAAARVMTWLAVAGRYTLRHGPIENGDRPLAVAQYADRSIDALGGTARSMAGLDALAARVPTLGSGLSEQLDSRLHRWASAAREELQRTIPATQVMANIASIGTLMMASTHRLHTLSPSTPAEALVAMTSDLRGAADALKEAEATWKRVTTLQPQGRAFGAASFELFDTLRKVLAVPAEPEKRRARARPRPVNSARSSEARATSRDSSSRATTQPGPASTANSCSRPLEAWTTRPSTCSPAPAAATSLLPPTRPTTCWSPSNARHPSPQSSQLTWLPSKRLTHPWQFVGKNGVHQLPKVARLPELAIEAERPTNPPALVEKRGEMTSTSEAPNPASSQVRRHSRARMGNDANLIG